ncbi:hypothetical protein D9M71_598210 [compost metagenome]
MRGGINTEDALVHASLFLKCAADTAYAACECPGAHEKGLMWSTMHSIETAQAIIDALLDGAEGMAPKQAPEKGA